MKYIKAKIANCFCSLCLKRKFLMTYPPAMPKNGTKQKAYLDTVPPVINAGTQYAIAAANANIDNLIPPLRNQ